MTESKLQIFVGNQIWKNERGQFHRENGPAIELKNGYRSWLIHGRWHRIDGPAREFANGEKQWYYHGKYIKCQSQEEFERIISLLPFE